MRKPAVDLRSLFLIILGIFLLTVLLREDFWVFLHPRLHIPAILASFGICELGVAGVIFFRRRKNAQVPLLFIVFLFFSLAGFYGREKFISDDEKRESPGAGPVGSGYISIDTEGYEFTFQGKEYTPINLGELYLLGGSVETIPGGPWYTVRGMVKRRPGFDESGCILLARVAVTCCLADATLVLYRVAVEDAELYEDGEWLQVFGTLTEDPISEEEVPKDIRIGDLQYLVMETERILSADAVERKTPPSVPFMFEFQAKPPFAF